MKKITFEISNEAYILLLNIYENNIIDFRNTNSDEFIDNIGLIDELLKFGLVDGIWDAQYLSFKVSDFGKRILQNI